MGKVASALAVAALLFAATIVPLPPLGVDAQTTTPVACSGTAPSTPMQGHYTGPWHSTALYHFAAFGRDLQLGVTIDGTLDVTVGADGKITGTVQGKVDAPVTHEGQRDVSSGYGTISGAVQGTFAGGGALIELPAPVIDMHWGTFVAGGYTVERFITMPTYTLAAGSFGCVSASGTISEQDFPVQNIVDDANGLLVQLPGIGSADGTWQITSDASAHFAQLSQQVDQFIAQANAVLNDPTFTLSPTLVDQRVAQPLRQLETTIRADPSVARCLLDRLAAWEVSVLPGIFQRAASLPATDLVALRTGSDLVRVARSINLDCGVPEGVAPGAITNGAEASLDSAFSSRAWANAALTTRELLLLGGNGSRASLQQRIDQDIHARLSASVGDAEVLEVARVAYAFGDDADATAAFQQLSAHSVFIRHASKKPSKKHHKRKPKAKKPTPKPTATPSPTPTATATPTPTPTPMPTPRTLQQILAGGITQVSSTAATGSPPIFSWQPVTGASQYVVTVTSAQDGSVLWTWSGNSNSVSFGDTAIDGMPGSGNDAWSIDAGSYRWSVLALDGQGQIVGGLFRSGS
jgi:hypothetical protein